MPAHRQLLIMAAVAVLAAAGGYFLARSLAPGESRTESETPAAPVSAESLLGQPRPDFLLSDMNGRAISAEDFDGKVLLVNFWATWCKPCVEEMPMLSALSDSYRDRGLAVLGVAVDDPDKARAFAIDLLLSYPVALGTTDTAVTGRKYGNRSGMLPYSVLIDREGVVRWTHLGALVREDLLLQIDGLL